MKQSSSTSITKETDYLIVGAGAMGIAFADEIFTNKPKVKLTIVERREKAGGHWNNAYPFVRLHQPAAFYGVNSLILGNGSRDLSSKTEILAYYEKIIAKFQSSGRVEFLANHKYLGNGQVANIHNQEQIINYKINQKLVDATYMKVEVPSTHAPKYEVDGDVHIIPINNLVDQYDKWDHYYVIGNGKTGMDAVLYLLEKGVSDNKIHWICPNQAWLFNRDSLQVGQVAKELLKHAEHLKNANRAEDIFLGIEKTGGIFRLDQSTLPKNWRCATINSTELKQLRRVKNIVQKGRVKRITSEEIELDKGRISYGDKSLFIDCSANGLSKQKQTPVFSEHKITLQSILFCQQVFSAAAIAKLELSKLTDQKRNQVIPVPHPEYTEDWPAALSISLSNLLLTHQYFPMWMFRSRLNFMSHESLIKYFGYSVKAFFINSTLKRSVLRLAKVEPLEASGSN